MKLIVFEEKTYYKMYEEMLRRMYKIASEEKALSCSEEEHDFLTTTEALKLLKLKSRNRLYNLREQKEIVFYQHGRRVLYSKKSIIAYIKRQKIT